MSLPYKAYILSTLQLPLHMTISRNEDIIVTRVISEYNFVDPFTKQLLQPKYDCHTRLKDIRFINHFA